MNTTTVSLVATDELLSKLFLDRHSTVSPGCRVAGIASTAFQVDSSACKSKFAAWLVEHVPTTRRSDDLSVVHITLPMSEEDLHVKEFADEMLRTKLRSKFDMERLHDRMLQWIDRRKGFEKVYAEDQFRLRTIVFDWPVLGSRAADYIEDPVAYFDMCAGRIRSMRPVKVALWGGREPPESFQICKG